MAARPNFVFFLADQMRADTVHHLGNPASRTPNLDSLCTDAVSFSNAYCQNPVCVPSRCSFLTGWYPHTKGHRTMHYLLEKDDPMLLKFLKQNGYLVEWIGRNDVIPADHDFSPYCDEFFSGSTGTGKDFLKNTADSEKSWRGSPYSDTYYSFYIGRLDKSGQGMKGDWVCISKALEFLETVSDTSVRPFCLYISLTFPHPPYGCEDPWFSNIDRNLIPPRRSIPSSNSGKACILEKIRERQRLSNWSEERFTELRATYLAMVSRFDYQLGLIVDKLKDKGLYNDTNLLVFSDHGDYTGDYGIVEKNQNTFEDPLVNVPLIIKPSAGIGITPRITPVLAELVDIPATVADLAGLTLDYVQFGKSLRHVLEKEELHRDAVFSEGGRVHGERQAMELGHGKDSLYWPRLSCQASEGDEHSKAVMIRTGHIKYIERLYGESELYDLEKDPEELFNVINDSRYHDLIPELQKRLLRFYIETTDYVPDRRDRRF